MPSSPAAPDAGTSRTARETEELLATLRAAKGRRRWPFALAGLAAGAAAMFGWTQYEPDRAESEPEATQAVTLTTAEVSTLDLISYLEYEGALGFGETIDVAAPANGTVTFAVEPGTVLRRGDTIARINDEPVVLWYGETPGWRDLGDTSDPGIDIEQLEQNLVALGFEGDVDVDVDGTWTSWTTVAVENWETSLGVAEPTGIVRGGYVIFASGPVTISEAAPTGTSIRSGASLASVAVLAQAQTASGVLAGEVTNVVDDGTVLTPETVLYELDGDPVTAHGLLGNLDGTVAGVYVENGDIILANAPILTTEVPAQRVSLDLAVNEADEFALGQSVEIEFPDGALTTGRVAEIGTAARVGAGNGAGSSIIPVTFDLDPVETSITEGPVTIRLTTSSIIGATVIPVRSLVALAEGGYAVELMQGDGTARLVGVELGDFQDGLVEVRNGALEPGDEVVVPS